MAPVRDVGMTAMSLLEKAIRALVTLGGKHRYLSTYCVDGDCVNCRRNCKNCKAPCLCSCGHPEDVA